MTQEKKKIGRVLSYAEMMRKAAKEAVEKIAVNSDKKNKESSLYLKKLEESITPEIRQEIKEHAEYLLNKEMKEKKEGNRLIAVTRYYKEEQVNELLEEQRRICADVAGEFIGMESKMESFKINMYAPEFPESIEVVPVEKVKELIKELERLSKRARNPIKESVYIEHIGVIKEKLLSDGK